MPVQTWNPKFPKGHTGDPGWKERKFFANSPHLQFIKIERSDSEPRVRLEVHYWTEPGEPRRHIVEVGAPAYYDTCKNLTMYAFPPNMILERDYEASVTVTWKREDFPERQD